MKRKSFVSIVFYPDKVQVLKLNNQKDKVEKVVTTPLAPEVIVNYQVENSSELTTLLKNLWKKENITEKSVGIVIPEFSTFTKLLKMPKLEEEELDEAVRWQSQEFLPTQNKDVVIDWQIIDETGTENQILVIAVQQSVLAGYVKAVGAAGLLPLVVETPSISLMRATEYSSVAKLIIFVDGNEAVLTIAKNKAIIGSSVIRVSTLNDIIQTASLILRHYEEAQIKSIIVGGKGITEEITKALNGLGWPVDFINQKFSGLAPAQIQEYIIPLSLQLKENIEVNDKYNINLLPSDWVKHYKDKLTDIRVWGVTLLASALLWITFLGVMSTYIILNTRYEDVSKKTGNGEKVATKKVIEEIGSANNLIKKVDSVALNFHSPETVINTIFDLKPPGVEITSVALSLVDGNLNVKGVAERSEILFDFRQAFEEHPDLSTPSLPIRNITQQAEIVFDLQLDYLPATAIKSSVPKVNLD